MQPSIGRIIHYQTNSAQSHMWPAIINEIKADGTLGIWVFASNGGFQTETKTMAAGPNDAEPGQWWWPERR